MPDTEKSGSESFMEAMKFKAAFELGLREGRVEGVKQMMAYVILMYGKTKDVTRSELKQAYREMLEIWGREGRDEAD